MAATLQCDGMPSMLPTQPMESPPVLEVKEHFARHKQILAAAMVAAVFAVSVLALQLSPSGAASGSVARRLGETLLSDLETGGPITLVFTVAIVAWLSVLGAHSDKIWDSSGTLLNGHILAHLVKLSFIDSVDQLVSVYLAIWVFEAGVGDGSKVLAVLAVIFGMPAFFAHTYSIQIFIKGEKGPYVVTNAVALLADICSVSAMAVIEFTAEEKDDLPGWLKGMDWIWSVLSIMGEMYSMMSDLRSTSPDDSRSSG